MRPLYGSFAWAYDIVVTRPGGPAVEDVARVFRSHGAHSIVDAGCGTGAYADGLAAEGFEVVGVDRSPRLLAHAPAASAARFEIGDIALWRPPAPVDGVLCRGVLNDLLAAGDRLAALSGLRSMLSGGGVAILDVRDWDGSVAHYTDKPVHEVRAETPRGLLEFESRTALEPAARMLLVHERIGLDGDAEEFEFAMRCWTPEELAAGLGAAGFASIDLPASDPPPRRSDRIVAVATA